MAAAAVALKGLNTALNTIMLPLVRSPLHRLVSDRIALITYTGRRSGKIFTTPVSYDLRGDEIHINVAMPDHKRWWRNFDGDGHPITLRLAGADHRGHATATRDDTGHVHVTVTLTD